MCGLRAKGDVSQALIIPSPTQRLVVDGWWQSTVVPWVDAQTDTNELSKAEATLAAMEAYYLSLDLDATEIQKARRYVEIGIGKLLPSEQGKRSDLTSNKQVRSPFLPMDESRFRQMAAHETELIAHLENVDTANAADQLSRAALLRIARDLEAETARTKRRATAGHAVPGFDIRNCSCAELFASGITPRAVITDPPYPKEYLPVFAELAEAARNVPLVAVMSGQMFLPDVLARLCEKLKYRWTMAYLTPGASSHLYPPKVNQHWKPVFVFGEPMQWLDDVVTSIKPDKAHHEWGQSESGMAEIVERLTDPGDLVCDPFLGAGTTAVVCKKLGRSFVGCDIDEGACKDTLSRLQ